MHNGMQLFTIEVDNTEDPILTAKSEKYVSSDITGICYTLINGNRIIVTNNKWEKITPISEWIRNGNVLQQKVFSEIVDPATISIPPIVMSEETVIKTNKILILNDSYKINIENIKNNEK